MASVSQPFFKKSHDAWYCEIRKGDGSVKTKRLAKGKKNKKAADDERCRIVAMQADPSPDMPVRVLCAHFLRHCRQNNSPASLNWYNTGLSSFCRSIPKDLKVCDLRKWHVLNWVDECYPRVGPNKKAARTRHGMLYCVQRVFNWACDTDRLTANPLARLKKPKKTPREGYLMPEQFEKLAAKVHDRPFRDFLLTLRHTGCRPIEARTVEAVHFHPAERCWLMPNIGHGEVDEDASQMRRVPLNQMMMELTARLAKEHPTGPLFRNADGNAWTKDALHCRFYRLQVVLKFKVTSYMVRHTFITDCIMRDIPLPVIADWVGHRDMKMILEVYQHVKRRRQEMYGRLEEATAGLPVCLTCQAPEQIMPFVGQEI